MRTMMAVLLAAAVLGAASCGNGEGEKAPKPPENGKDTTATKPERGGDYLSELGASKRAADQMVAKVAVRNLALAVDANQALSSRLPKKIEDLSIEVGEDPWGNPYRYALAKNKKGYRIWSLGPDGKDGTEDDITSADQ